MGEVPKTTILARFVPAGGTDSNRTQVSRRLDRDDE